MRSTTRKAVGVAVVGAVLLSLSLARSPVHVTELFDLSGALAAEQVQQY